MLAPRFTIARMMVITAGVAGALAIGRWAGWPVGVGIIASLALGGGARWVCRDRPVVVLVIFLAVYLGVPLGVMGLMLVDPKGAMGFAVLGTLFGYPTLLGAGLAELDASARRGNVDAREPLIILLLILPLLAVVPLVLFFVAVLTGGLG